MPDGGGLLTGDKTVRCLDHFDPVGIQSGRAPLIQCRGDGRRGIGVDVEVDLVGVDRGSRGVESVEHQVWGARQQLGILAAQRFTFSAVAHQHRLAAGDRGHLDGGGEPGAPATGQARLVEQCDQSGPDGG